MSADPATAAVAEASAGTDRVAFDRGFRYDRLMASISKAQVAALRSRRDLLPGEELDVRDEVAKVFDQPDLWLTAPNAHFGGLSPSEAIMRGHEAAVRNLLRQIIYVGMS